MESSSLQELEQIPGVGKTIAQDMKKSLTSQPELAGILPRETEGQKKLFELLDYAYIGARYHDDYKITPQELKYLARCVELLRDQIELSC